MPEHSHKKKTGGAPQAGPGDHNLSYRDEVPPDEFYDSLADNYDNMTRFAQRFESEKATMEKWRQRFGFKKVLDVACGTGLHAIALAQLGLQVTAADLSEKMLQKARQHADEHGVKVRWIQGAMEELDRVVAESFDAIFCLGNSIPHLLTPEALERTVAVFTDRLNKGGILVVQLLNYHNILKSRERIINIRCDQDQNIVRFYDFDHPFLRFNILTFRCRDHKVEHQLHSTKLYPYGKEDFGLLSKLGYHEINFYGNMNFDPWTENARNLVVVGRI